VSKSQYDLLSAVDGEQDLICLVGWNGAVQSGFIVYIQGSGPAVMSPLLYKERPVCVMVLPKFLCVATESGNVLLHSLTNPKEVYKTLIPFGDEYVRDERHTFHQSYYCSASRRIFIYRTHDSFVMSINTALLTPENKYVAKSQYVEKWHMSEESNVARMCGDASRTLLCVGSDMGALQLWCTARAHVLMVLPSPSAPHLILHMCLTRTYCYVFAENFDLLAWKLPKDLESEAPSAATIERRQFVENEIVSMVPSYHNTIVMGYLSGVVQSTSSDMWAPPQTPSGTF
jgi:hypothetical protein